MKHGLKWMDITLQSAAPQKLERMEWMGKDGITPLDLVRRCVVAWDLLETDLLAGGAPVPAPLMLNFLLNISTIKSIIGCRSARRFRMLVRSGLVY